MRTVTGYLTNVVNPHFSGIATVFIRGRRCATGKAPRPLGRVTKCYTEAGHGVRQLAAAFDRFSPDGLRTKARFQIDDRGVLLAVEII